MPERNVSKIIWQLSFLFVLASAKPIQADPVKHLWGRVFKKMVKS